MIGTITIPRGDDRSYNITIKDAEGAAINITGYTVFFTVKKIPTTNHPTDDNAVIKKVITSHVNAAQGITSVSLSRVDTKIDPRTYNYDIQIKDAGGNIMSSGIGEFIIEPEVTEAES